MCKLVPLLNTYFTVDFGSTCICYKTRSGHSSPPSLPGLALGWACLRNCKIMYHYTRILLKRKKIETTWFLPKIGIKMQNVYERTEMVHLWGTKNVSEFSTKSLYFQSKDWQKLEIFKAETFSLARNVIDREGQR